METNELPVRQAQENADRVYPERTKEGQQQNTAFQNGFLCAYRLALQSKEENKDDTTDRFFLARDNDSHWYVVPVSKEAEWIEWLNLDGDDPKAWSPPDFVKIVGGSPSNVTFKNPKI